MTPPSRPDPAAADAAARLRRLLAPAAGVGGPDAELAARAGGDDEVATPAWWQPTEVDGRDGGSADQPTAAPGYGRARAPGAHRTPPGGRRPPADREIARPSAVSALRDSLVDRLPATLRARRVAVSSPAAVGLVLVAVLSVLAVALLWHLTRPTVQAVAPRASAGGASAASRSAASSGASAPSATGAPGSAAASAASGAASPAPATARVVVDVAGRVRRPGVVDLPPGARVVDALTAAGGALAGADLRPLNLARRLGDGEQVLVLASGEPVPPGAARSAAGSGDGSPANSGAGGVAGGASATAPLDLNTATAEQFDALPGVGPVLAGRIVSWREAHGRFSRVEELQEVTGIGASRFADLKALVRV